MNLYNDTITAGFYFDQTDFTSRMGANCYWSSIAVLLRYRDMLPLALPHLHLGSLFNMSNMTVTLEIDVTQHAWLGRYMHVYEERLNSMDLAKSLCNVTPAILKLNLLPLGKRYPAFPCVQDHHYVVSFGLEKERFVRIVDLMFGFASLIPLNIIEEALFTETVTECGYMVWIRVDEARYRKEKQYVREKLRQTFRLLIDRYLSGVIQNSGLTWAYGMEAVRSFVEHIDSCLSWIYARTSDPIEVLHLLIRRLNDCFIFEREGIVNYLILYSHIFDVNLNPLIDLLNESLQVMRQLVRLCIKLHLNKTRLSGQNLHSALQQLVQAETAVQKQLLCL